MNRDKELILKILRYVRDNADGKRDIPPPDVNGYEACVVSYHVRLCWQAGFLELVTKRDGTPIDSRLRALTWDGHNHLEENPDC